MHVITNNKPCGRLMPEHIQMMASKLKEDRLRVLINHLSSEITCIYGYEERIVSTSIELVDSAYTVSMRTATCEKLTVGETVLIQATDLSRLQRVATSPCFHGKKWKI